METKKEVKDKGIRIELTEERQKPINKKRRVNSWYYFGLAGEIGFSIAIPIVSGALLGKYIDSRIGAYPKFTVILLFAGLILSMVNLFMVIKKIIER